MPHLCCGGAKYRAGVTSVLLILFRKLKIGCKQTFFRLSPPKDVIGQFDLKRNVLKFLAFINVENS